MEDTDRAFSSCPGPHRLRPFALALAVGLAATAAPAEAQCLKCSAGTESSSCSATGSWGFCCVPGFVVANVSGDGSSTSMMTVGPSSLELVQSFKSPGCCTAQYANIGIYDACQASDQYGQTGSHLPIQLKDLALLKGAWTFQVPMPLGTNWQQEQYRVYYEMFLSDTPEGYSRSGNVTIVFFWNLFGFDAVTGHAAGLNGAQGMDYIDNGNLGIGQGPFVDFLYPTGTFAPDGSGVVTVTATDVKAVLDYAVAHFPQYYSGDLYLAHLSLAVETGAFMNKSVKTTFASFAAQKAGSAVVVTPPFTAGHWSDCTQPSDCDDGNACTTDACSGGICTHATVASCGAPAPTPPQRTAPVTGGCSTGAGVSLALVAAAAPAFVLRRRRR